MSEGEATLGTLTRQVRRNQVHPSQIKANPQAYGELLMTNNLDSMSRMGDLSTTSWVGPQCMT